VKFFRTKNLIAVWLFALILNAFSVAVFSETPKAAVETVYCPLTKKLQPVKAPKKQSRQNPLTEICAADADKASFTDELFSQNLLKTSRLDEKQFENLVFDFFQKGKAAFANLPSTPDSPRKNSIKTAAAVLNSANERETQIVWKNGTEEFSLIQNPRPPNSSTPIGFEPQNFSELEKLSRSIAPRAPPVSL
jgi:hypothetical protein